MGLAAEFKLSQIGVIMLGVQDVKHAVEFYRDKLGLSVTSAFEGFAFLATTGATLVLSEALARAASASLVGATEVVFSVPGVRAAYEGLRARGVEFTIEPRAVSGPMWAANFRDPDGHGLSIFGPERA
jgi:catechol 2,3-dioxygenase-like lactoylglutathione lyase family enzyme